MNYICTSTLMNHKKMPLSSNENDLAHKIIGFAIEIHKNLGPGLLESTYRECLYYELIHHEIIVEKSKVMPIKYKDLVIEDGYTIDLLIDEKMIVEVKSVDHINDTHIQKVTRALKLGNLKLGLLINFNETLLKDGVRRVVTNIKPPIDAEKELKYS